MATAEQIGTRAPKLGNLVKDELWAQHGYCRKVVTAQEAAATTYEIGTVLGEITASGKYIISASDAVDGSEAPAAIVVEAVDLEAATDAEVVVMFRGPAVVADAALILDATWTGSEQDVYDAFEAVGIAVREQY
jgi:hypothetical protein